MAKNSVAITEYLEIDLDAERWSCRRCGHDAQREGNSDAAG